MKTRTVEEKIEAIKEFTDFEIAKSIKDDKKWIKAFLNFIPHGLAAHNLKNLLEACDRHFIKVISAKGKVRLSSKVTRPTDVKVNPASYNEDESKRFDQFFNEGTVRDRGYVGSTFRILLDDGYRFEVKGKEK